VSETITYGISVLEEPDAKCKCVGKHIPRAMELHRHHVWPLGEGGPDTKANLLILCPTTHSNVHMLWRLYEKYDGRPPWDILKNYSEYCRSIVEKGRELRRQAQQLIST
jgi:hypothetical protein